MDFARVVPAIMEAPSLRLGLARAAPGICEAFGVDRVSIFVPQAGETLIALLQHGLPEQQMLRIPAAAGRSIAGYVIAHRRVARQEARRGDCDAQALLQWARLGGVAGGGIAEVSEELERRR